jgi:coproporphyrinogen III oxidase
MLADASMGVVPGLYERAASRWSELQSAICLALEAVDGSARFSTDRWERSGGGGGVTRVLEDGAVFEKAGVNWSDVSGELPEDFAAQLPGEGRSFRATGVSLVLHPRSPMVPTTHANFRFLEKGDVAWFGGGADLTPYYLWREDAEHFHRTLAAACDAHAPLGDYPRFKQWCDEYFLVKHRGETRGVGGIFYDYIGRDKAVDLEAAFAMAGACGDAFVPAYVPIVQRRMDEPYGDAERRWQLVRRGRYVEFNLVYDRGTTFGLKTGGRIESILMSLPPLVRWDHDVQPPGARERELVEVLQAPVDWLGRAG